VDFGRKMEVFPIEDGCFRIPNLKPHGARNTSKSNLHDPNAVQGGNPKTAEQIHQREGEVDEYVRQLCQGVKKVRFLTIFQL